MRTRALMLAAALLAVLPGGARASGGETTGITSDTITIGIHAPATGAAPVRPDAFTAGANLLWQYYENDLGLLVNGRHVRVEFKDDAYNPTQAVAVCDQMAQDSFFLMGSAGTDQVYACAQYSAQHGIPYLSPGMQETGLDSLATYFALSPSWAQQAKTLADYVANELGPSADRYGPGGSPSPSPSPSPSLPLPVGLPTLPSLPPIPVPAHASTNGDGNVLIGLVRPNTANYDDAQQAIVAAFRAAGDQIIVDPVAKEGSTQDAANVATDFRSRGVDVAIVMTAPVFTTTLMNEFDSESYAPLVMGPTMTDGFNDVLANTQSCGSGGGALDGASFFSPWPAVADADTFDPDFMRAVQEYAPGFAQAPDLDWLFALWGEMKDVRALLVDAGPNLDRQSFVQMMDDGESISTGVWPDASFSSSHHFGSVAVHRIEASCADQRFHERDAFVSDYPPQGS